MALLEVEGLRTYFKTQEGTLKAVDGVDFTLEKGHAMGLAGESGCGKTTAALSIMKLLPANGYIAGGKINFMGQDMARVTGEKLRAIRWRDISIVFQGAMNALNPVKRVGEQIAEPILLHEDVDKEVANKRVKELFELVGLNPNRVREYPHEFSGGMRQRVMIAMALACKPRLVIADEPTTALDVMIQAQILELMKTLQRELELAMIIISHDLSVLAETCETLCIMYAGKIVERADSVEVFRNPQHPYTQGLIAAFPNVKGERTMPGAIAGNPPNMIAVKPGCRFADRCSLTKDICLNEEPPLIEVLPNHYAACHVVKPR
ncbi:MAG: ABC transporter ATP-binding protein [Candidatus Thermoplasmatota archaeon]|nr:ABC transporter ATP-binding protein [Candidatus Thermoplasmatota archaeon]